MVLPGWYLSVLINIFTVLVFLTFLLFVFWYNFLVALIVVPGRANLFMFLPFIPPVKCPFCDGDWFLYIRKIYPVILEPKNRLFYFISGVVRALTLSGDGVYATDYVPKTV